MSLDILKVIDRYLGEYMGKYGLYIVLGGGAIIILIFITKILKISIFGFGG